MGYAQTIENQYLEILSDTIPIIDISTVGTLFPLNTITLPIFNGSLRRVCMELVVGEIRNDNGLNSNALDEPMELWFNDGSAWYSAFTIDAPNFILLPGETLGGAFFFSDGSDIKTHISSGLTITTRIYLKATINFLYFHNVQTRIRLYFGS
jgi:hypothetical protein